MIKIFITDCDGCLTNGLFYYTDNGKQMKTFNCKDGLGLFLLRQAGILTGIVSGDTGTRISRKRADDLNLDFEISGVKDKVSVIEKILKENNINWSEVCYFGDDVNDLEVMKKSYLTFCPKDAHEKILEISDVICKKSGGLGCVREACDFILEMRENYE